MVKTILVPKDELNRIIESMNGNGITKMFKQQFKDVKPTPKFEVVNNSGSNTSEFTKEVLTYIRKELEPNSRTEISKYWHNLNIDEAKLSAVLTDMGLLGYAFNKLSYSGKIKKIRDNIKLVYDTLVGSEVEVAQNEETGSASSGSFEGPFLGAPINVGLTPSSELRREETGSASNGAYDTPGFSKGSIGKKLGYLIQNVDMYDMREQNEAGMYVDGEIVTFDDCTKLNNNKEAENGGCSSGASDGVVKLKRITKSVAAPSTNK